MRKSPTDYDYLFIIVVKVAFAVANEYTWLFFLCFQCQCVNLKNKNTNLHQQVDKKNIAVYNFLRDAEMILNRIDIIHIYNHQSSCKCRDSN